MYMGSGQVILNHVTVNDFLLLQRIALRVHCLVADNHRQFLLLVLARSSG